MLDEDIFVQTEKERIFYYKFSKDRISTGYSENLAIGEDIPTMHPKQYAKEIDLRLKYFTRK